jgi:nitroreductase
MRKIQASGDYFTSHFADIPLLVFVFAIDDHGGANIYPAIWSALFAARAEGIGGVITTVLRYAERQVMDILGVPAEDGWELTAMLALGYPLGRWGWRPTAGPCTRCRRGISGIVRSVSRFPGRCGRPHRRSAPS